ncbi:MAG: transglycosylase SLT domain-containing protein [Spirochaetaceae bacterium]|nr:transglycosylase SLT domain-containing protein [Spirochaetaceae bacterium]
MNTFVFRPYFRVGIALFAATLFFCSASGLFPQNEPPEHILLIEHIFFDRPLRHNKEAQVAAAQESARFWLPNEKEALPSMSIEGFEKPLSRSFVSRYTQGGNKIWLLEVLERGGPYMAFIQDRIREKNLPEELLYIPAIESAFVPTVVSRSGAAGLWQFMRNSMEPWLTSSDWIDERLDFWASTDAALSKLQLNYTETKDWPLALAAYNSGLGAIRTLLKKHPGKDYWDLSTLNALKTESVSYVPKLLAVYYIASNPRRTGFENFWPERVEWEQVSVGRQADLRVLAEIAGINAGELQRANAELRFPVTPPGTAYKLKVRAEMKEPLASAIAQTEIPLVRSYTHVVSRGDTIYGLARTYGIPEARIFEANPGIQERVLQIGDQVLIPAVQ